MSERPTFINDVITVLTEIGKGEREEAFKRISESEYEESTVTDPVFPEMYKAASLFVSGVCLLVKESEAFDIQYLETLAFRIAECMEKLSDVLYDKKVDETEAARTSIATVKEVNNKLYDDLVDIGLGDFSFLDISMVTGSKATILMGIANLERVLLYLDCDILGRDKKEDAEV